MAEYPINVYLDRNDAVWTSQRYYMDQLRDQMASDRRVRVVEGVVDADVVHLNFLNPTGRVVWGKRSRRRHVRDVGRVFLDSETPVVVTEHGVEEFSDVGKSMYVDAHPALQTVADAAKRLGSSAVGRRVDAIIAISSMDKRFLVNAGFPGDTVHLIPHGVHERFLSRATMTDTDFVLHVSKCSPHKNPAALLETARRLDTTLKVVGWDWQQKYGEELTAIDGVEVLGYVDRDRLLTLYRSASVLYLPSIYEPFGLPILEAMASETPVVASINSAGPDIGSGCIDLVDPDDTDEHIAAIERLLDDEQYRRERAGNARARAESFTWDRTAASTIAVYEQVVAG